MTTTRLTPPQLDRALGTVVASAAGDALGSQYEFGPPLPDDRAVEFGPGVCGHEVGEWTDDTSMAVPILRALAAGRRLEDPGTCGAILEEWIGWASTAKDVGSQTRAVLNRLPPGSTEEAALVASETVHREHGRSGGNGSLMRTGPVPLGYLFRAPQELVVAAGRVARLTHWEHDNADACALWSLAIRHAVLTGEFDVAGQVQWLPAERRARWAGIVGDASAPGLHPRDFAEGNGWVVRALQAAVAAITGADGLVDVLERAVRGGQDTDTIAAIAGSLAGALYGADAVPLRWRSILHGWPGVRVDQLEAWARDAVSH